MSFINYTLFPSPSTSDIDFWMLPDVNRSLSDFFDIFDPLDLSRVDNRLDWIVRPEWLSSVLAAGGRKVPYERPRKYRIAVDIRGLNKHSVKTHVSDDNKKLIVYAKEGEIKDPNAENYTLRELKRTYRLPAHAEVDKLASYMAPNGKLIIEIPLGHPPKEEQQKVEEKSLKETLKEKEKEKEKKEEKEEREEKEEEKVEQEFKVTTTEGPIEDILPRVAEGQVEVRIHLPEAVDASKVKVTCKDGDLIVMVRDEQECWDNLSELFYYRRTPMPGNTDFDALKCTLEGNHLYIKAPVKQQQQGQSQESGGGKTSAESGGAATRLEAQSAPSTNEQKTVA